jgi:copper(I)-binding protein
MNVRRFLLAWLGLVLGTMGAASAHDFKAGDLRIDHPYATPSRPGVTTGAVYFRGIRNTVAAVDRLLSASTPVAGRVEIHRMRMQGDVMQMRAVPALDIPGNTTVPMRHNTPDGYHLMLFDLKAPLKDGDRFLITLTFDRAGTREVNVWVQTPRSGSGAGHAHPDGFFSSR